VAIDVSTAGALSLKAGHRCTTGETAPVRIGTWNLAGRWDTRHRDLIRAMDCDVLLLTEVSERVDLRGYDVHLGHQVMAPRRRWAAVASRLAMSSEPDPHGASAMVTLEGLRICSSILPWRSCGAEDPWVGTTSAERTSAAVAALEASAPSVWGGDWNHALSGREWAGSEAGREHLLAAVERLDLQVPTASLPHQIEDLLSIDHIAVPKSWTILAAQRHRAFAGQVRISDHDAYVVDAVTATAGREGERQRNRAAAPDSPLGGSPVELVGLWCEARDRGGRRHVDHRDAVKGAPEAQGAPYFPSIQVTTSNTRSGETSSGRFASWRSRRSCSWISGWAVRQARSGSQMFVDPITSETTVS
jgi:hypothetical protein